MILKLRMADGTYFDFDTERHIEYTDYGVFVKGTFVYKTGLSETFYKDYNIPRRGKGEEAPTDKQLEMRYIASCAAKNTVPLQLGRQPRKVQFLTPEEWYEIIEPWKWLGRNMPEESTNPWWQNYYYKLSAVKSHCFMYLVMVYGLCAKEAAMVANSSDWDKKFLTFTEDREYNKRQIKHFDEEIQKLMEKKKIDFPQDVYTMAYD